MNINGNQVKIVYGGTPPINPDAKTEININSKDLFITPINVFNPKEDEGKHTIIESEKQYEIIYKDINHDEKQIQSQIANNTYRNIFSKDQEDTKNESYMIFQNHETIEFDDEFMNTLEQSYSKDGIFMKVALQVPYDKDNIKLYATNISFPLCITDVYSHKEFSIVNRDNNKTRINTEDDLQLGLNNYKEAIEDSVLFTKFM